MDPVICTAHGNADCIRAGGRILTCDLNDQAEQDLLLYETLNVILPCTCVSSNKLTLREDHRLRAFDNAILKGTPGPIGEEITQGWRNSHNEKMRIVLYSSLNLIRVSRSRRVR
jgi:hypothetical protein